ncbi:MAG: hypothetical protein SGI92_05530 [Bryobacteraceae bacterium]|nr:hypothetical protein [Bryobacteraceae bacterium]
MRGFTKKQRWSLTAILLTVATFAMSPPDAFCRTQSGNRTRASRTVRLDDHDHDFSPDLRPDDHTSGEHAALVLLPESPVQLAAALRFAGMVWLPGTPTPGRQSLRIARGRAPPLAS